MEFICSNNNNNNNRKFKIFNRIYNLKSNNKWLTCNLRELKQHNKEISIKVQEMEKIK